jgi:hypothetical protein
VTPVSRPLLVTFSVLTGLNVVLGGAALAELVDPKWIGLAVLGSAGLTAGLGYYVRGQVTPWPEVAAQRTDRGLVAGPAAPGTTAVGEPVDVLANQPYPGPYTAHPLDHPEE